MFVQEGKPSNENYCLGTSCRRLDWQLSFVTQIASQLSPSVLSSVHSLSIKKTRTKKKSRHNNSEMEMPSGGRRGRGDSEEEEEEEEEDVDSAQWLELFQPFRHLTQIHVWEKWFVPGIVQALTSVTDTDTDTEAAQAAAGISVLPELSSLHLSGYRKSPSVAKAAEEFVAARRLAGRTVRLIG